MENLKRELVTNVMYQARLGIYYNVSKNDWNAVWNTVWHNIFDNIWDTVGDNVWYNIKRQQITQR